MQPMRDVVKINGWWEGADRKRAARRKAQFANKLLEMVV